MASELSAALLCHVNLARTYRGGERQTELLIRSLGGRFSQQRLIARKASPLAARLRGEAGIDVVEVSGRLSGLTATARADLIHAHEAHAAQVARTRQFLSATPYVITRRVDNVPSSNPFTRSVYSHAARVVALSKAIREVLAEYDPAIDVRCIPSAASNLSCNDEWVRDFRARFGQRLLVGSIGALDHSHKGQFTLIQAAELLAHHHPRVHFILVGSGRDEGQMRKRAATLENVTFAGWVDNVGDYLGAFDLFAYPSLHEGLGSILIDAMQFGLPVVASDVGGIPDLIVDGKHGLLVPPEDAPALAEAIRALLSDSDRRRAISEANIARAREYRPEVMAERYIELYSEILEQRPTGEVSRC
jgi:glycosyltransferase involved in cell wall biosynthesis